MTAYVVANYRVTNPEGYSEYPALASAAISSHGGEILVADRDSEALDGSPGNVTVVIRFASKEAAMAWYESDEYQKIRFLRTDNAEGFLSVCE
jgi:uncharacterized protein (DUF1330 family)